VSIAHRFIQGLGVAAAAALAMSTLVLIPTAAQAAPVILRDGSSAAVAAGSCWEIKQNNPASADGTYWLLTPKMAAPAQFYCDQTTDGGGWVLIGKGREGWSERNGGTGTQSALRTAGLSPMSGATTQMPADTVDSLLNGQAPDSLTDGIRLKRATTADGTQWQEARFNTDKMDRWVWTFGAEHQVKSYSFNGVRGSGGLTSDFGPDKAYNHVNASETSAQAYTIGFAFGSGVTGTNASGTYLWSNTNGLGYARPYTEVYLRPQVRSSDPGFTRIADAGTAATTNVPVASSFALNTVWGLTGPVSPKREGDVEAQAFVQSGNTMYVGGNFTSVQRTATSTGADKVAQSFLAAFDINTGELVRSFTPQLNGSVMTLALLPNGDIVAGGMFSAANGAPAPALVALDPATGATATNWNLNIENRLTGGVLRVSALSVEGDWLYLGGAFTHLEGGTKPTTWVYARGAARVSLAAGTPDATWNPDFNGTVVAVDASSDGARLYASGYFTTAGTAAAFKAAAVQATAGAPLATPAWNPVWSSSNNYQQAIQQVGDRVWVGGSEHSLFSYSTSTFDRLSGNIGKNNGDFQAISSSKSGVIYAGSHGHDWNYSNAFFWPGVGTGWTEADSFEWVGAWDAATGNIIPSFTPSMKFRLGQGIWASTVDSNGTMWAGGDMTTVATASKAGAWTGGFARFPQIDATAPTTPANVSKSSDGATTVKLAWSAATDNSGAVSYQVLRNDRVVATTSSTSATVPKGGENRYFVRAVDAAGNLSPSSPVITATGGVAPPTAAFTSAAAGLQVSFDASTSTASGTSPDFAWDFGDGTTGNGVTATHTYAALGSYRVTLTVTDSQGQQATLIRTLAVTRSKPADAYGAAVFGSNPTLYYRLGDTTGTTAADSSPVGVPGTYVGGVSLGAPGAIAATTDGAAVFNGSNGFVASQNTFTNPSVYSLEVWFKTTTTRGGKLIGFGDKATGTSSNYDRHIYMQDNGQLVFGTYTGTTNVITSSTSYNDGAWHHVVATQSSAGMVMYVDGASVGTNPQTAAQSYTGYWRIGGDTTWGSSSPYFAGTIDEAAVYPTALTAAEAASHFQLGSAPAPVNQPPTADFTPAVTNLAVAVDATASTDPDGTIASYAWDFGDGSTGTGVTATHSYAAPGPYTVTLTVTDNQGATATKSVPVTATAVPANQPPVADFTPKVTNLDLAVDATASTDPDGTVASYAWDFGDGSTGTGVTATHTYAAAGPYTVTLTVTDNQGATATKRIDVTATAAPVPPVDTVVVPAKSSWAWSYSSTAPAAGWKDPGFDSSAWATGAAPLGFGSTGLGTNIDVPPPTSNRPLAAYFLKQFTVSSAADVRKLSLSTVADDGVVVYVNGTEVGRSNMPAGDVTFNTYASSAVNSTVANANPVVIVVPTDLLVTGTNTIAVETHLNFRATKDLGFDLNATLTTGGTVPNQSPIAQFSSQVTGLGVAVDATASTDPDGAVVSYAWDFGDTSTGQGATATHTYAAAGTYTVALTVKDNEGATSTISEPVTVARPAGPVDVPVIPAKSSWSWRYQAGEPDAAWKNLGFDASTWNVGAGVLGFGSSGLGTNIDVPAPTSNRPLAAYFISQFNVDSAAKVTKLVLNTVADDGAVVYVNGTEVARSNMPAGTITSSTYALSAVRTSAANANPLVVNVPVALLVDGINTVAVETHVNYRATPDLSFDLSAVATVND
jgi:PKD repeat protein